MALPGFRCMAAVVVATASFLALAWIGGCASAPPAPKPACQPHPRSDADAIVRIEGGTPGTLDGRPLLLPQGAWERLGCDHMALRLPPGPHSMTLNTRIAGDSFLVKARYSWFSCRFDGEPGHRYRVKLDAPAFGPGATFRCEVEDETLGHVVGEERGCVDLLGIGPACPEDERRSAARAEVETLKAYAACGDPAAIDALDEIRERDDEALDGIDWELPECQPIFDHR